MGVPDEAYEAYMKKYALWLKDFNFVLNLFQGDEYPAKEYLDELTSKIRGN